MELKNFHDDTLNVRDVWNNLIQNFNEYAMRINYTMVIGYYLHYI